MSETTPSYTMDRKNLPQCTANHRKPTIGHVLGTFASSGRRGILCGIHARDANFIQHARLTDVRSRDRLRVAEEWMGAAPMWGRR